jgi:hypothetical protein
MGAAPYFSGFPRFQAPWYLHLQLRTPTPASGRLLQRSALVLGAILSIGIPTEAHAGGLIEVRREPKFVYYNGFASSYSDVDHDSAEEAFSYGQGLNFVCSQA